MGADNGVSDFGAWRVGHGDDAEQAQVALGLFAGERKGEAVVQMAMGDGHDAQAALRVPVDDPTELGSVGIGERAVLALAGG